MLLKELQNKLQLTLRENPLRLVVVTTKALLRVNKPKITTTTILGALIAAASNGA